MYPYRCGAAAVLTLTTVASIYVLGTLPGCTHSMCVCVCVCVCVRERERASGDAVCRAFAESSDSLDSRDTRVCSLSTLCGLCARGLGGRGVSQCL